jgi:hypothetical protein
MIKKCNIGRDFVANRLIEHASLCQQLYMSGSLHPLCAGNGSRLEKSVVGAVSANAKL